MPEYDLHTSEQRDAFDRCYGTTREYWFTSDPVTHYVICWRLFTAIKRLMAASGGRFTKDSSVLFLCSGDGAEASQCCDEFGFTDVTFSDLSSVAVQAGIARDPRLKGVVSSAEAPDWDENSFDVVIVQDGLHHLRNPVLGFTTMLHIARVGVIFVEPHDALVGNLIGTKWETGDGATNYVFRWTKNLVEQVASSWFGCGDFCNLSFSYWHHNIMMERFGRLFGGGAFGKTATSVFKYALDLLLPGCGNGFTGMILKHKGELL